MRYDDWIATEPEERQLALDSEETDEDLEERADRAEAQYAPCEICGGDEGPCGRVNGYRICSRVCAAEALQRRAGS